MEHVPLKCKPQADGNPAHYDDGRHCPYCEGEIMACATCKAIEGSLTTDCPGYLVEEEYQQLVYKSTLDFKDGVWYEREPRKYENESLLEQRDIIQATAEMLNAKHGHIVA